MTKRTGRMLTAAVVALALAWSLLIGGTRPQVAYGEGSTPTPTVSQNSSDPGGSSGGGH
jgi:hypothetical protein